MTDGQSRPREVKNWTICEDSGQHAINGRCPMHGGDRCLIVVAWVDNSHVRREVVELRAALGECYGSYQSLIAYLRGIARTADKRDGPFCARRALGIEEPSGGPS